MMNSSDKEPTIIAHHREQLAYLLTEAAEIEHGLMCCYLFAAYSLKRGEVDGLSAAESATVVRWRSAIIDVAIDEMLYLALVINLLATIGQAPHFERPNFPVSPGYYPAGVVPSLAPFRLSTMDHFIYLERPEGVQVPDGAGFEGPAPYERRVASAQLVPSAQDYATAGHLSRGIRAGLAGLAGTLGEERRFVGDVAAPVGPDSALLDGLIAVTDLRTAFQAVDKIVEQGEGSPSNPQSSHFRRVVIARGELRSMLAEEPGFEPSHPVARNPVMRRPPVPGGEVHIDDPRAARVLDFGNAVYAFALRCLGRAFGQADEPAAARRVLVDSSLTAMRDMAPVMQLLARLPANAPHPGVISGLTFTMQRSTLGFSQQRPAWVVLAERAREIARASSGLARDIDPSRGRAGEDFAALAGALERENPVPAPSAEAEAPGPSELEAGEVGAEALARAPAPAIEQARAEGVLLRFEARKCIVTPP